MEENIAPICLFTYNRLSETQQTVEALKKNYLATESKLFIFSDGPKSIDSIQKVEDVRKFIKTITGFKDITVFESTNNKGLAESIIDGVNQIINKYGKVIVLEDDLITSKNFLDFMNQALNFYEKESKVLSVSGYSFSLTFPVNYNYDVTFGYRASSWGWGIWKNRWEQIDWDVNTYSTFSKSLIKKLRFNRGGSDMATMLNRQMRGEINSWAIRFCYHQFINNLYDVFPKYSKVQNIGFSGSGTNCNNEFFRFKTKIDTTLVRTFEFVCDVKPSNYIMLKFYWQYSITMRMISKLIGYIKNL